MRSIHKPNAKAQKAKKFLTHINKMMRLSLGLVDSPTPTLRHGYRGQETSSSKSRPGSLSRFFRKRAPY